MADWLRGLSDALPLSYAVEALHEIGTNVNPTGTMWRDLTVVAGAVIVALVLAAGTLRRRTA
jgi:ABC-2 type transport system permease protein